MGLGENDPPNGTRRVKFPLCAYISRNCLPLVQPLLFWVSRANLPRDPGSQFVPEPALRLSGFVLAHAVWSVSDTVADELLCPLAIVEWNGERLERLVGAGNS